MRQMHFCNNASRFPPSPKLSVSFAIYKTKNTVEMVLREAPFPPPYPNLKERMLEKSFIFFLESKLNLLGKRTTSTPLSFPFFSCPLPHLTLLSLTHLPLHSPFPHPSSTSLSSPLPLPHLIFLSLPPHPPYSPFPPSCPIPLSFPSPLPHPTLLSLTPPSPLRIRTHVSLRF